MDALGQCDVMKGPRQAKVPKAELIVNYMVFIMFSISMKRLFFLSFWIEMVRRQLKAKAGEGEGGAGCGNHLTKKINK